MKRQLNKNYPLQVWLMTIIVGCVLEIWVNIFKTLTFEWSYLGDAFLAGFVSLIFSLPIFFLSLGFYLIASKKTKSQTVLRILFSSFFILCLIISAGIIWKKVPTADTNGFNLVVSFLIMSLVSSFTFKTHDTATKQVQFSFEEEARTSDNK